ncbi:HAMP domain-containing sensor histidine kinase [Branchiibius sp. NY16-3462-2]|uniref:sensor histidine kinase n=1 Tax=Branchiibius sp. NY16-3462-2 TaxID=1807500 RepID=UPI00079C6095|nr:HAMP domain-containing sensor histidine kinase [Branchiibius sp. NY16-3462-2]KYH44643.1 hypothetical protein AZH51_00270 [Branchiibius sp. NY16-3462-2]
MPLRARLTALLVAFLTIATIGVGVTTAVQLRSFLMQRQDSELQAEANLIGATLTTALDNQREITTDTLKSLVPSSTYVVSVTHNGTTLETSLDDSDPPDLQSISTRQHGTPITVKSVNDTERWRVVTGSAADGTTRYAVAVPMSRVNDIIERLIIVVALGTFGVVLAGGILGWFAVRRAMTPLRRIEDTARAIADGDLARRVPEIATRDEVASLSHSLNVMLSRIEQSFELQQRSEDRMRQFVADASHELRTPLATVRGYAELYRQGAIGPDDVHSAMGRIEGEATRMAAMVDDLLLLTRFDNRESRHGQPAPRRDPVDLTVLAADAVQDALAVAPDRSIRLVGEQGRLAPTPVTGDESALRQVLNNLVNNALRYTPSGSPLEVQVGTTDSTAVVRVVDHGPGVPEASRERIFERFYRADSSRNSADGGSGLGLAIVAAIVATHDGTVAVSSTTPGPGATFTVSLPAGSAGTGGSDATENPYDEDVTVPAETPAQDSHS